MLADPRSDSLVTNFAEQWLLSARYRGQSSPTSFCSRISTTACATRFERETELFLDSVLRENRSVLDLLTANYTFVNERLAKHYGIPERPRQRLPARHLSARQPARRTAGAGQHSDDHVLREPDVAGAARQVGAGESSVRPPPPPPPPNVPALKTEGQRDRQDADHARSDDRSTARIRPARVATRGWIRSASRWRTSTRWAGGAIAMPAARSTPRACFPDGDEVRRHGRAEDRRCSVIRRSLSPRWPRSC